MALEARQAALGRPAAIAVHDDADMEGRLGRPGRLAFFNAPPLFNDAPMGGIPYT